MRSHLLLWLISWKSLLFLGALTDRLFTVCSRSQTTTPPTQKNKPHRACTADVPSTFPILGKSKSPEQGFLISWVRCSEAILFWLWYIWDFMKCGNYWKIANRSGGCNGGEVSKKWWNMAEIHEERVYNMESQEWINQPTRQDCSPSSNPCVDQNTWFFCSRIGEVDICRQSICIHLCNNHEDWKLFFFLKKGCNSHKYKCMPNSGQNFSSMEKPRRNPFPTHLFGLSPLSHPSAPLRYHPAV